jgi:hypothetical protein
MTAVVTTCRDCGTEFTPDRRTILRGEWKCCPACRPADPPPPGDAGATAEEARLLGGQNREVGGGADVAIDRAGAARRF